MSTERICSFEGCGKAHRTKGLCEGHYAQIRRGQDLKPLKKRICRGSPPCKFEECPKDSYSLGYCPGHYWQLYHNKPLAPLREKASKFHMAGPCSVARCFLPKKAKGLCDKHYFVAHKYNLDPAEYEAMQDRQGHKCGICRTDDPGGKGSWHIDHDHDCCPQRGRSCGKCVRQLLCNSCNTGLGLFRDSPELLLTAAKYLESHGKKSETSSSA